MRPVRKADNLPPPCAVVTKSGSLNFLEPSGPVQACNGTVLLLPISSLLGSRQRDDPCSPKKRVLPVFLVKALYFLHPEGGFSV